MTSKSVRVAYVLAVSVAIAAIVMYSLQGGFGGGHGPFDLPIFILGLPWDWMISEIPDQSWPDWMRHSDFTWLIFIPSLMNLLILSLVSYRFSKRN